ncbi:catechol 1,2-dioxygenase [Klebsiella aerogenes]|nr:catechol 1,2-dioxygenase [Klebsiella aerogenes]
MSNAFVQQEAVQKLLREGAGLNVPGGNERFKAIVHRLLENICTLIDDYNVTEEEFWHAVNYLHELGGRQEAALLAAGLGLEHFLDLRQDAIDAAARRETGTPRTIEGPLYVANAPLADSHARMDDGTDAGEVMWLHGQVKDNQGQPIANAIVISGTPIPWVTTRFSIKARATTTSVAGSALAPMAATACAASCRPATAARRMVQPRSCWIS